MKRICFFFLILIMFLRSEAVQSSDFCAVEKKDKQQKEVKELQERFDWWPTDATPGPVKDEKRGGYWWWPEQPGKIRPWGNRGYVFVRKIIFDYKEEELPPAKPKELRPSLLIKKVIKNIKIYFDYDKTDLRADHIPILEEAAKSLKRNPDADILITGNCDRRGSEAYNQKLGIRRGESVKNFMIENGIKEDRVRIVSKGKLDAVAPITDLVGMQKDRNAQFMIAEVEEIMMPCEIDKEKISATPTPLRDEKHIIEKDVNIESEVKVSTKEYVVNERDTLKSIAQEQLGGSHRWRYLYEFNKEHIQNPDSLEPGTVIVIPVEQEKQKEITQTAGVIKSRATRTYTIVKKDSLWKVSQKQLGDGKRWKEIYDLNKDKIKNPDKLIPGTKIEIPEE